MLKIRLQRTGRKHEPTFRVVLTDSKNSTKSGKFLEVLGSYDPRKSNETLNEERVKYWLSQGAQTSGTVHNMLVSKNVISGKKINVLPKKTVPALPAEEAQQEASAEASAPQEETSQAEPAQAESPAEETPNS